MKRALLVIVLLAGVVYAGSQYAPTNRSMSRQEIVEAAKQEAIQIAVSSLQLAFSAGYTQCMEDYHLQPSSGSARGH